MRTLVFAFVVLMGGVAGACDCTCCQPPRFQVVSRDRSGNILTLTILDTVTGQVQVRKIATR